MTFHKRKAASAVVFNDTRVDRHHGCTSVMNSIEDLLRREGIEVDFTVPAHTDWEQDDAVLRAVDRADLLLVNGEGTIHHDRIQGKSLLKVAAMAKSRGIPSALINTIWQKNGDEFEDLARQFDYISARDTRSERELKNAGIACDVVPDLSLYVSATHNDGPRRKIGFTDSVNAQDSVRLSKLRKLHGGDFVTILTRERGVSGYIRFMRAGVGKRFLKSPRFLSALIQARHASQQGMSETPTEFIERLSHLELLVTGRFHACTLSMVSGTPFVAFPSNTHKIEALVEDAGLEPWRTDAEIFVGALEQPRSLAWTDAEVGNLEQYLDHARQAACALFAKIRCLV